MATQSPLFQILTVTLTQLAAGAGISAPGLRRFVVLVTALATTRSTKVQVLARQLASLGLHLTRFAPSLERGLRRTLADDRLTMQTLYQPILATAIPWQTLRRRRQRVILILDESSRGATEHLARISLACWGDALTLGFRLWQQNVPLKPGTYWRQLDGLLAEVAALVPPDLPVILLADRAYDIPPFLDRLTALGWHFVIRLKGDSDLRYRDPKTGKVGAIRLRLQRVCGMVGTAWQGRLDLFKAAGWRRLSVQAVWTVGHQERLVVISDLSLRQNLLALYDQRFWIEASFRHDKLKGLGWEQSGVVGVGHHERLLLAMAWVTLLALANGLVVGIELLAYLARPNRRRCPRRTAMAEPPHAKESIFTMGLAVVALAITAWGRLTLTLADVSGPSWNDRYRALILVP
jgi:hypothetical protein